MAIRLDPPSTPKKPDNKEPSNVVSFVRENEAFGPWFDFIDYLGNNPKITIKDTSEIMVFMYEFLGDMLHDAPELEQHIREVYENSPGKFAWNILSE